MPAPFQCSACGFTTKVKDQLAGKKIKCPKCQAPGLVGSADAPVAKKKVKAEDSEDALMSLNLDSYEDVEPEEGEILDESKVAKLPKKKKKTKKGKGVDPQAKALAAGFSVVSALVLAAVVYYVGIPVIQEMQKEKPPPTGEAAEKAVEGNAPPAAE